MSNSRVSRELTAEAFVRLLGWFDPDPEKAAQAYERARFRLIAFFSSRNVATPEDLADEVLDRIALKEGIESIENPSIYIYGFAKMIFMEYQDRLRNPQMVELLEIAAPVEDIDRNEVLDHLRRCLAKLPAAESELILEYMTGQRGDAVARRKVLYDSVKTTKHSIRMRVVRIKRQLRACLEKRMA